MRFVGRWLSMQSLAVAMAVGLMVLLAFYIPRERARQHRIAMLEHLASAFRVYAEDSRGGLYPPRALDGFHPDWEALNPYLEQQPDFTELTALWGKDAETPLCYLGHVLVDEEMATLLLDRYETIDPCEVRDTEFKDVRPGSFPSILRFREGVERFFIHDIGNPASGLEAAHKLPLFWELPPSDTPGDALVVYLDGHWERQPYPGRFPLVEPFVRRTRAMMGIHDPPPTKEMRYRLFLDSPVIGLAREINAAVVRWELAPSGLGIAHCDVEPSVKAGEDEGYSIVTEVEFPAAHQQVTRGCQVVLFPMAFGGGAAAASEVAWEHRIGAPAYLGVGRDFHWYCNAGPVLQDEIRRVFALRGGEDRYPVYARAYREYSGEGYTYARHSRGMYTEMNDEELLQVVVQPNDFTSYRLATLELHTRQGRETAGVVADAIAIVGKRLFSDERLWPANEVTEMALANLKRAKGDDAVAFYAIGMAMQPYGRKIIANIDECHRIGLDLLEAISREVAEPILRDYAAKARDADESSKVAALLGFVRGERSKSDVAELLSRRR